MRFRCSKLYSLLLRGAQLMLATAFLLIPLQAQSVRMRVDTVAKSGVTIDTANLYGGVPVRGYVPVRVTIDNNSGSDGVWAISADAHDVMMGGTDFSTVTQCQVPAHSHDTFEVLAPLDFTVQAYYMRSITVEVQGPGVNNPRIGWSSQTSYFGPPSGGRPQSQTTVVVGLSSNISTTQGAKLSDYYQNKWAQPNLIAKLDPDLMSTQWRAYIGFDMLVLTSADWLDLSADVRAAILQWVAAGGDLRLVADQDGGLSLPPRLGEHYGAGAILFFKPDDLANYDFTQVLDKQTENERLLFNFNYQPLAGLASRKFKADPNGQAIPAVQVASGQSFAAAKPVIKNKYFIVAMVIVVFGLVVGPINLFVFCRGVHRARLLWVTPLLSVGASGLLLAFIFLSEGMGGRGIYYRVTQLAPDGKFAVETQVSASITGMLFAREFNFAEPAWVQLDEEARYMRSTNKVYSQLGSKYWGDWFASRETQVLTAEAVLPTRAAVRLEPAAASTTGELSAPSLRSEYNGQMTEVYYLDVDEKPWKAAQLSKGQVVALQPCGMDELESAWQTNVIVAPIQLRTTLGKLAPLPGTFFALGDDLETPLLPNVAGLSWTSFRHVITGPVVK